MQDLHTAQEEVTRMIRVQQELQVTLKESQAKCDKRTRMFQIVFHDRQTYSSYRRKQDAYE
jgi:hypothetical protein